LSEKLTVDVKQILSLLEVLTLNDMG